MKKAFLLMLCFIAFTTAFAQKDLNSSQLKLRTEIYNFLREEGYAPEIDSDGDIAFKRSGERYYIIISEVNDSPMYVRFEHYWTVPDQYTGIVARLAAENLTRQYKAIKCYYLSSSETMKIAADMFLRSSEPFKQVYYQLCSSLDDMESDLMETLIEESGNVGSSNAPLTIQKIEMANVYKDGSIETDYGYTIYDIFTMYLKPKITYTGHRSGKINLKVKFYNADGNLSTSSSSPTGFSYEDDVTIEIGSGKTFTLSGWGGTDKGHWKEGTYRLEIWYENTCLKKHTFEVY